MTDQTLDLDKLLKKLADIDHLMNPENGGTAGEIAAAAAKMQHLLTKHGLSLELVKMHRGEQRQAPTEYFVPTTDAMWPKFLITGIAKANYGRCIQTWRNHHAGIAVVCHKDDWETIRQLIDKFTTVIEKMAPQQYEIYKADCYRQYYEDYPDRVNHPYYKPRILTKRKWCNDWRLGCAQGIGNAMMRARREAEQETEGSSALVVLKGQEVDKVYHELYPDTVQTSYRHRHSEGHSRGYATGQSLGRGSSITG